MACGVHISLSACICRMGSCFMFQDCLAWLKFMALGYIAGCPLVCRTLLGFCLNHYMTRGTCIATFGAVPIAPVLTSSLISVACWVPSCYQRLPNCEVISQQRCDHHHVYAVHYTGLHAVHVLSNVPLQVQKHCKPYSSHFFICAFHVNPLSRTSPRYLTYTVSSNVCPQRVGPLGTLNPSSYWMVISPSFVGWYTTELFHTSFLPHPKRTLEALRRYFLLIRIIVLSAYPSI